MRLLIQHETIYRYSLPATYSIQQLRLTPRNNALCRVAQWQIKAPKKILPFQDAFDNASHTLVIKEQHNNIAITVNGEVHTVFYARGVLPAEDTAVAKEVFLVSTPLTEADPSIVQLGEGFLNQYGARVAQYNADTLLQIAVNIKEKLLYVPGSTQVHSTAAQALLQGQGVCQDHAHLMLSVCRNMGLPARYVSGYVDPGGTDHVASHAWVDVWSTAEQAWVSLDITNAEFASDKHCRLAIGRDYDSAAPIRGIRRGGGDETMQVHVQVTQ